MSKIDYSEVSQSVEPKGWDKDELVSKVSVYVWDAGLMAWVRGTANSSTNPTIVTPAPASTSAVAQVPDNASNVTLLSANPLRLGGSIYNDSSSTLYLKLGSTASSTSYTTKLFQDDYFEIPFQYIGEIDGIWSSAAGGNAYTTELTL